MFDAIARSADPRAVPAGTTVQWDFADAEPWHVRAGQRHHARRARQRSKPDVTLRMTLEDFGDVIAERADARRLVLRRRVRVRGNPRLLMKLPRVFG